MKMFLTAYSWQVNILSLPLGTGLYTSLATRVFLVLSPPWGRESILFGTIIAERAEEHKFGGLALVICQVSEVAW